MTMVYYTLLSKKHHCPVWDIDLTITAKYRFFDSQNPHIGKYCDCTCPIVENLKLPTKNQLPEYKLYRFCKMEKECLKSVPFDKVVDFSKTIIPNE